MKLSSSLLVLFALSYTVSANAEPESYFELLTRSDVVAVVVLTESDVTLDACPSDRLYRGIVGAGIKNARSQKEVLFRNNTALNVQDVYLVFLTKAKLVADSGPTNRQENSYEAARNPPCDYFEIETYGGRNADFRAIFEERYLSAKELQGVAAEKEALYLVGDDAALGLFLYDPELLGLRLPDGRGGVLSIEGRIEWHVLDSVYGASVASRKVAFNRDQIMRLFQETIGDTQKR